MKPRMRAVWRGVLALACLATPVAARADEGGTPAGGKGDFEGLTPETAKQLYRMYSEWRHGRTGPVAAPDIFGHGSVLNVGKVVEKVTNFGFNGNPFTTTSSDPSGQWPGQSGVEYLFAQTIAVGGVNPQVSEGDPVSRRRVSSGIEWRPPTLAPEDHIYPAYEGIVNGKRFFNDDGDKNPAEPLDYLQDKVDEDFLDGRDNDGDGAVDEDYGAVGQQMFSLVMRDDTPEAIRFTQAEPHVPVGLEIQERAWAYSLTALENFNVFEYHITNVSGHEVDSLFVGFPIDMDCGPVIVSNYYSDDLDVPQFPSGQFWFKLPDVSDAQEPRLQKIHDPDIRNPAPGKALCTQIGIRVNGYSIADDNSDDGKTPGMPSFLLFDHTIDPLGVNGPPRVGFRAFRSYAGGTTFSQGGPPRIDQQRFEFMSSNENIDPETGFINAPGGDQKGDYAAWSAVGPWLHVQPNASITVTVGYAVQRGTYAQAVQYPADYAALKADSSTDYQSKQTTLFSKYPAVKNAFDAQLAFEGVWEARRAGLPSTDWHGRETGIRGAHGSAPNYELQDCRDRDDFDGRFRPVQSDQYTWFDFDCDYCTGVWSYAVGNPQPADRKYLGGFFHKTWNASAPPPSPVLNSSTGYNFTDNPTRLVAAAGDNRITLAWDNTSQISADPGEIRGVKSIFDFRGYKVYKVAGWTRPVGSPGPAEDEWSLVAEFACFDYRDSLGRRIESNQVRMDGSTPVYPKVWIPQKQESLAVELHRGDLWDRQSGHVLRPDSAIGCVRSAGDPCDVGACEAKCGRSLFSPYLEERPFHYPVGFYRFEDNEVRNGFLYFYSVTAYDSSFDGETEGRKSAVEAEGVTPQAATKAGQAVWVVPNPYKGRQRIADRPSTWDLTPNATDPTGTHIDFMGLPPGRWTIRIYTVAGDLVQEIRSTDAVNQSLRGPVTTPGGVLPGFNRQQDTANDGQASWNLISRNGQDIVSGVYLFVVDSSAGLQRGRFVVIR
ncbi:MAG TPA: hypothetical protein VGK89_12000 [Candidatus Eisenbacteria bacterium]|jgi:hypothetical protein